MATTVDANTTDATTDGKQVGITFDGMKKEVISVTRDELRDTDTIVSDKKLFSKVERNLVMRKKDGVDEGDHADDVDPEEYNEAIHEFVVVDTLAPGDQFKCKVSTSMQHYIVLRCKDGTDSSPSHKSTAGTAAKTPPAARVGEKRELDGDGSGGEPAAKKKPPKELKIVVHGKGQLRPGQKAKIIPWIFEDLGVGNLYRLHAQPCRQMKWAYFEDEDAEKPTKVFGSTPECFDHVAALMNCDVLALLESEGAPAKFPKVFANIDDTMFVDYDAGVASSKAKSSAAASALSDDGDKDVFTM